MHSNKEANTVCLLIHGYLGTPFEMQPLVLPLKELGLAVRLLTLPGHGAGVEELLSTRFTDWAEHALKEYDEAAAEFSQVIVIGFSLGGALALHIAERRQPLAVVSLSAPVFPLRSSLRQLLDWTRIFIPLPRFLGKSAPQRPGREESQTISPWEGHKDIAPYGQFYGLLKGFRQVGANLGKITAPILVIQDAGDKVVNADNARAILEGVSSRRSELEITHIQEEVTVRHIITTHRETSDLVINRVRKFVASVCGLPEPEDWKL